jgi:RNA polymerase sigma-70 factor (sigma-E family)
MLAAATEVAFGRNLPDRAILRVNVRPIPDVEQAMEAVVTLGEAAVVRTAAPAFEDVFPRLYGDAYRVAYRLLGDRSEAEDVAQEACARAYSRWSSVNDYAEPWCVRVAGNLALDGLRARVRSARRAERLATADDVAGKVGVDERLDLYAALERLPRRQRETVLLRYLGDQSEQQTAAALGISVGSVKTHASRGLAALREVIER